MFYIFPKIIEPEVCNEIVKDCMSKDLELAAVGNASSPRDDPKIRKTSVYFVPVDKNNNANKIAWGFLKEANKILFHYDLTYFQQIQFAKYSDGEFYDWHVDTYETNEPNKTRKLSMSLMLTDPNTFTGGEFQFYNGGRSFEDDEQMKKELKTQGTIVVFDSRDFHRVTPVTKGTRHSIVCWATGVPFK